MGFPIGDRLWDGHQWVAPQDYWRLLASRLKFRPEGRVSGAVFEGIASQAHRMYPAR